MTNELVNKESTEVKYIEIEKYKDIKMDEKMSVKDSKEFWADEFSDKNVKTDDNGKVYRVENELVPNNTYEINGYKYQTDAEGRIVSAEGKLQIKDHEGRSVMDSRSIVDRGHMKPTDDRGHVIADMFNGSGGIENVVPMDAKLNQGDYKALECTLADAVKDGAKVDFKVEPIYQGNSTRPSEFKVTYSIDGDKSTRVFRNGE